MSYGSYSTPSVRRYGDAMVVCLTLLLAGALLVAASLFAGCTIQEITLYKTVNLPSPKATPR